MTTILIVEDDPYLSSMYQAKLEIAGYYALTAADGPCALRILSKECVDVVLLDILLPGNCDGICIMRQVNEKGKSACLPHFIVLTNVDDPVTKQRSFDLGAKDYIVKAYVTPAMVTQSIKKVLSSTIL